MNRATIKNLAYNSFGALINGVILILLAPLYLNIGGPDLLAQIGYWLAVAMLFQFLDFGSSIAFTRALSQASSVVELKSIENINLFSVASLVVLSAVTFALQVYFTLDLSGMFMSLNPSSLLLAVATQLLFYFYSQGLIGLQNHKGYSLALATFSTFRHLCALAALHLGLTLDSAIAGQFILMFLAAMGLRYSIYQGLNSKPYVGESGDQRSNLKYSFAIMWGALISGALATSDRFLASGFFSPNDLGNYLAGFIVAGALTLIPLPIYRVYFPIFSASVKAKNMDKLLNDLVISSALVTSLTAIVASLLFLNAETILLFWVSISDPDLAKVIRVLLVSFGFISFGWMPATLLQVAGFQNKQSLQMAVAILMGCTFTYMFHGSVGLISVTAVWALHGIIQICICPSIAFNTMGLKEIVKWYMVSLAVPALSVAILLVIHLIDGYSFNQLKSSILYVLWIVSAVSVLYFRLRKHNLFIANFR